MLAYRLCKPSSSRVHIVYEQHISILLVHCEPRSKFLTRLKEFIHERQKQGDLIIIGMNLNNPVLRYDHKIWIMEYERSNFDDTLRETSSCHEYTKRIELSSRWYMV